MHLLNKQQKQKLTILSALIVIFSLSVIATGGKSIAEFSIFEVFKSYVFVKGTPRFGPIFMVRSLLVLLISFMILRMIDIAIGKKSKNQLAIPEWKAWGSFLNIDVKKLLLYGMLVFSSATVVLFLANPSYYYILAIEDSYVENASAAILLIGSIIFGVLFFTVMRRTELPFKKLHLFITASFSGLFFLIAMEEVSWFQRALEIETPDIFEGNNQDEMNLHNYFTRAAETGYYFFGFLLLIFLPYLGHRIESIKNHKVFSQYLPGGFILMFSSIVSAHNYNMWDAYFTQLAFFITLVILIRYLPTKERSTALVLIAFILLTQLLFLAYGKSFVRKWDVTEYKELLIPFGFLMYSVGVALNISKLIKQKKYA